MNVDDATMFRFWSKVAPDGKCWRWTGAGCGGGYAQLSVNGKRILAHRFAFVLAFGPVPEGKECCHTCRTKGCVNPYHMYAGTRKENVADAKRDGTLRTFGPGKNVFRGAENGKTRVTDDEVREIRAAKASGVSAKSLAAKYSLDLQYLYLILERKRRQHVV